MVELDTEADENPESTIHEAYVAKFKDRRNFNKPNFNKSSRAPPRRGALRHFKSNFTPSATDPTWDSFIRMPEEKRKSLFHLLVKRSATMKRASREIA